MRSLSVRAVAPAALLLVLAACAETTTPDLGGVYRGAVESPFFNEGAAVVELVGPGVVEVSAPMPLSWTATRGDTTRLVMINDPQRGGGPLTFRVVMEEGFAPPAATVLEVVDGRDHPRDFLGTFRVLFTR